MIEWSEQHEAMRGAFRKFVEAEIKPNLEELEHGDTPPYDVLRKMFETFGIGAMQVDRFQRQLERDKAKANGSASEETKKESRKVSSEAAADAAAMQLIPIIELCRYCPGMITAMGVSVALTAGAIRSKGTIAQKEKFVPPLLTMDKVGAWAITEPGSGSDAFGSMKSTAKRDGDDYVLNGSKTFITNGPYADTIVFICKLDEGNDPRERKVLSFILDKGTYNNHCHSRKMIAHNRAIGGPDLALMCKIFFLVGDVPGQTGDILSRTACRLDNIEDIAQCLRHLADKIMCFKPLVSCPANLPAHQ